VDVIDRGCRRRPDAELEAALDEDDPPDPLGLAGGAGDGAEPVHRLPDDGCGAGADAVKDGNEVVGVCVDAERPGDRRTRAAAPQVGCDQRAAAVEPRRGLRGFAH